MTAPAETPGPLRAGAAQVDITPSLGVHLAGAVGLHRPAEQVADPLYAKALVLESGGRKLCFVVLDVTIVTGQYSGLIRRTAAERFGFDPDAVMVHATQTHSAPPLGQFMVDPDFRTIPAEHEWVGGGEERYSAFAAERAIEAIRLANDALQPAEIGVGSGIEGRVAFNRRAVRRDGTVAMPGPTWGDEPLGPTWIRYMEGPIDPELGVMFVATASGQAAAMLVHYTCHPVHLYPQRVVSADWPGALCEELQEAYGTDCVPLVLNGACGNINPWPPFDPDYVADHRRMGRILAATAAKVVESLAFTKEAILDWKSEHVKIPIRQVDPDELRRVRAILEENPGPVWADAERTTVDPDWMAAASIFSVHLVRQRQPELDYEIQAFRVGPAAFVGLPGEPFVEGGLAIKIGSPAYPTYIAHCTTEYVGYLPTKDALQRGGHEVSTRYWAKLAPEALEMVVQGAVGALQGLFPERPDQRAAGPSP